MSYRPEMRASDGDRERFADRLRDAHGEGRLTTDEFDTRIDAVFAARTYGELEPLIRDLPARTASTTAPVVAAGNPRSSDVVATGKGQQAIRALWQGWAVVVTIHLAIWVVVSLNGGAAAYFWPIWVAGPWGAGLLLVTLVRSQRRRDR